MMILIVMTMITMMMVMMVGSSMNRFPLAALQLCTTMFARAVMMVVDEAVKLWVTFLGKMVEFQVSGDESGKLVFSEGLLRRDEGCITIRNAGSDVMTLIGLDGQEVSITMMSSCGYVPFDATSHIAVPFSTGGGSSSGSGPTPTANVDDGRAEGVSSPGGVGDTGDGGTAVGGRARANAGC